MRLALVSLLVFRIVFADAPRLDVGWAEEFEPARNWNAPLDVKDGVASFQARSGAARWSHTTEPIWVGEYPRLVMRYRAVGVGRSGAVLSLRPGSVGPVTPGAANPENPFAKGMPIDAVTAAELVSDGAWRVLEKDLSGLLVNPRCDQITIALASGATLDVDYIRFLARPAATAARVPSQAFSQVLRTPSSVFRAVNFDALANTTARAALHELGIDGKPWLNSPVVFAGLPFETGRAWASTLRGRETLSVPVRAAASEVYLLAALRVAGVEFDPKRGAGDVERLLCEIKYDDGVVDQVFPYDIAAHAHRIADRTVAAFLLPARHGAVIGSVRIRDRAANVLVALLGVTLNTGAPLFAGVTWGPARALHATVASAEPPAATATVSVRDGIVVVDNRYYHGEFDARDGLKPIRLDHKVAGSLLRAAAPRLFDFGVEFALTQVSAEAHSALATYTSRDAALPLRVQVRLAVDDSPELRLSLEAVNAGASVLEVPLRFPNLGAVAVGSPAGTHYLFPRAAAVFGREEAVLEEDYSSAFPMQFIDLYNPRAGAGVYLLLRDPDLKPKRFRLAKDDAGASMSVSYSYAVRGSAQPQHVRLAPGETFHAADAALGFHRGDWRTAFNAYRAWVRTWYKPDSPRKAWFEAVYNCRRDYPLGGSGMLFDVRRNRYTFDKLIDEGAREFGGIDLVDISSWAYSERFGRVGEYTRYELGGRENFHGGIAGARERGVPTGLYLEGYLIDVRSQIGRTRARDWQIFARNQEPLAWNGAPTEIFICPRVPAWQDWMARTYAKVAADTGARAFYIDEFGFARPDRACYNPAHAHAPGATVALGERELMRKVRAGLDTVDREAAIYLEEMPPDANVPYADGAFCYAINRADERRSPGAINLYRFAFPGFKLFDMVSEGIDARAFTVADMKKSFFHANGLWLKGHAESWYPAEAREFVRKTHAVLRAHSGTFQSRNAEPLVETLNTAVLANRFSSSGETIYTLYNESYRTVRGVLLRLPEELRGRPLVDLLAAKPIASCDGGASLCMQIGPREVVAVGAQKYDHSSR
jgi:hypothetical protein